MMRWFKTASFLVLACLLATGCNARANANASPETGLVIQGNLKNDEISLNSKLAGVIDSVLVEEGQTVQQGQVLFLLDSRSLQANKLQANASRQAALGQQSTAEAALSAAQAQYEKALNGTRPQELEQAQVSYDLAAKTYTRMLALFEGNAISQADLEQVETQYTLAQTKLELAQEGTRPEDISAAKAQVEQASAAIEAAKGQVAVAEAAIVEVETYLEDAVIRAPADGRITALNISAGELISTGMALATLSSLEEPWVELKVPETDLPQVTLNQTVNVTIAAYPDQICRGTVVKINQKPDFATKRSTSNNGDFDVLSYGVKVIIQDLDHELYPGMTVFVDFSNPPEGTEAEHG